MIRNLSMAALAACLIWPAASVTQNAPQPRVRARPRVRVQTGPFGVYSFSGSHGRIGVVVDTKADAAGDKIGARIEGVTPGGPADKAGIKQGDVITRFNTTSLGGAAAEEGEGSGPGLKLIELAHRLEPGDTVQVEYRRGNENRKATIVAEELPMTGRLEMPGMPGMGAMDEILPRLRMQTGPGNEFEFAFGSPWGGIELVELNPELGEYFGTREGVLVVRVPEDSTLNLKGGDVILSIGGRKPTSPMQAMRILRSYDPGETVTLDVLRKQKHVTVNWKVPEENRMFHVAPRAHEEPSWFRVRPKLWRPRDVRLTRVI